LHAYLDPQPPTVALPRVSMEKFSQRKKSSAPSNKMKILTVKLYDKELRAIDDLAKADAIPRSEEVRRGIQLYLRVKAAERDGMGLVLLPKERLKDIPVVIS